ncbi:DUF58 domain-containing protein [Halorubrum sp. CBA1125]|uniref:DUF58 domain-containing protein n=1 Tax=Halorubrum sp. CBA1125 TaxID=2668072 RepID=UPI0012E95FF0|nr:DUF58 domain-containing protein [Halorubrum sp. CBA1125]MUW14129.1 DUF58 domain-containing protein [Halorubrum sp. CBA1125]
MDVTSRWWATAGSGLVFVVLGVTAERPIFLLAAAGVGAWLVGVAAVTSRAFARLDDRLTVECDAATADTFVDTGVSVTLAVRRPPSTAAVPLSVRADVPVGTETSVGADHGTGNRTVVLEPDELEAETAFDVSFPIAGRFAFPAPVVVASDPLGLYRVRFARGTAPAVTARPRSLDIHVGRGGEPVRNAYGEHRSDQPGPGVTTREIRQYVPGDSVRRIDWKATARLADIYIRETEGETDRRTALIVDHRDRMAVGSPGETMLDYAREVGIGIVRTAADRTDPIGVDTVGRDGVTNAVRSRTTTRTYARAETLLYGLTPTADSDDSGSRTRSATRARELADRLDGDDGTFARVLDAYVSEPTQYAARIREDPLVGSVRRVRNRFETGGLIVIVTSDDEPTKLREAVKTAIGGGGRVIVFLTPRCLFEPTGPTDLDAAYDRYLEFERFRRDLDTHPRVTALEIAPETRLDSVLAHRRETPTAVR